MRFPRTVTLPARNALMALPYCPEPPGPALMSSMRLSATSVPSSPIVVRRISMPLSLVFWMVLRDTSRPCASNDTIAVVAVLVMMLPLMSPETPSNQAAPRRKRDAAAIERDVGEADMAGAFALKHRRAARKHKPGRAANPDQLGA